MRHLWKCFILKLPPADGPAPTPVVASPAPAPPEVVAEVVAAAQQMAPAHVATPEEARGCSM